MVNWTVCLLSTEEQSLTSQLSVSVVVSLLLAVGYFVGVLGSSSFASWGGPSVPGAAALTAMLLAARLAYVRGGLISGLFSACLAFVCTAVELVFFEWVGFTFAERVGFFLDLSSLIVLWGCLFGCLGYITGSLLRRYRES